MVMRQESSNDILFGTDGWRGLLDRQLNAANVARVAQAFAEYLKDADKDSPDLKVAVGYDGRHRSDEFAGIFARVLAGNNIGVFLSDSVVPTPVLSFQTIHEHCHAGVMVTASHNPPQYNGIKFKSSAGAPLVTEETQKVEGFLDISTPKEDDRKIKPVDFMEGYRQQLEQLIDFDAITRSGLHIAIDSMAGAGADILTRMLKDHGIPCEGIYQQPSTDFQGRQAEPIEKNLDPLSQLLKEGRFSLGMATDGDADRLGVMTDRGEWMNIQETILALARYVKQEKKLDGGIVKTLSVTDKLIQLAQDEKAEFRDVQVGFKYVAEAMMDLHAAFGAEESGGFGFAHHIPERDGIFSALLFAEMVAASGYKSLTDFIENQRLQWGRVFYDRRDLEYTGADRMELLPELYRQPPEKVGGYRVKELLHHHTSRGVINSLKLYLEGYPRWLLIRISETEPVVRIYAEGQNHQEVQQLLTEARRMMNIETQ